MCVRTCDGFYFPVSYATTPARFGDDEQACKNLCPAAEATLFTHRSNEDMTRAVSINGQPYSALPNAFKYRQAFNPSCACKPQGQTWADAMKSVDDRGAVEQGDIIVTDERAKQLSQPAQGRPARSSTQKGGAAPAQGAAAPATPEPLPQRRPRPRTGRSAPSARRSFPQQSRLQASDVDRLASTPGRAHGQALVRLRQRLAGIAEAVGDRIAPVAAEILAASPSRRAPTGGACIRRC